MTWTGAAGPPCAASAPSGRGECRRCRAGVGTTPTREPRNPARGQDREARLAAMPATTVNACGPRRTVRPTSSGSRPNCVVQARWDTTATAAAAFRVVVGWSQQPAVRRRRPQHREEVAGYEGDVHPGRGATGNEREIERPEGRERERLRRRGAQLQVLGMAQRGETAVVQPKLQREEPLRVGQVERSPEVPIHRRQHDGGDAERERQRQHDGCRKRAAAGQRTQRAAEITRHGHGSCRSRRCGAKVVQQL